MVCKQPVDVGTCVVPFQNNNKTGKVVWDHVHAEGCADRYDVPALAALSSEPAIQKVKSVVSSVVSKLSSKRVPQPMALPFTSSMRQSGRVL